MRNPKGRRMSIDEVCVLAEEINNHSVTLREENAAGKSADYGNDGYICSITVECMVICSW